jgi:peptidoglycan/LPS O-acetylase OafA/YrhL
LLCVIVFRHSPPDTRYSLSQNPHWAGFVSSHILASLFYSHGFIFGGRPALNIVLWSLEIEVQFYIVAPFLARVFNISTAWKRRALIAASMIVGPLLSGWINGGIFSGVFLTAYIEYFLAGFLLADFYLSKTFSFAIRGFKWDLIPLGVLISVVFLQHATYIHYLLPWLILIGCVAGFHGRISSWFLSRPLITTIGGMCYTIYMYHFHLLSVFIRAARPFETHVLWLDCLIQTLIMATLIVLVCSVLFAVFERPFMRRDWPARFWSFIRRKGVVIDPPDLAQPPAEVLAEK